MPAQKQLDFRAVRLTAFAKSQIRLSQHPTIWQWRCKARIEYNSFEGVRL
jgi:hypothetical protein